MAQSTSASQPARAPISAHPAFPAIVALWFAALLGLGSLVLPIALIERLVTVTRIASLIPAAEPPLGFTARAAIALGASIAGAVIGLLLARKVANSSPAEPRGRSFSIGSERECRPISAHDELGEDGLDSASSMASLQQKRRSLAIAEDNRPSAYLQPVPLPGQSLDDRAELPSPEEPASFEPLPTDEAVVEAVREPLELADFAAPVDGFEDEPVEIEVDEGLEALRRSIHAPDAPAMQDSPMTEPTLDPTAFAPEPAHSEPLPFAAPSLRRSLTAFDEDEPTDASHGHDEDEFVEDEAFDEEAAPQLTVVERDGDASGDDRPVEELGLVQLAARLGTLIETRRAWLAQRHSAVPAPAAPLAPFGDSEGFEAAEAEDAARAIADFFGPTSAADAPGATMEREAPAERLEPDPAPVTLSQAAMPAPLRGLRLDHDEEDDEDALAASLSLPLTGLGTDACGSTEEAEEFDEAEPDDGEYSSLLAMKNPFARQQEFVRVEEPEGESGSIEPAVTFPAPSAAALNPSGREGFASASRPFDPPQKPVESELRPTSAAALRDPGEAERSLRDALATLQRMSGAA